MMEAAYRPKGERFDIDKEEHEMNAEGKSDPVLAERLTVHYSLVTRAGSLRSA